MFRVPDENRDNQTSMMSNDLFYSIMSGHDNMGGGLDGQPAGGHQLPNIAMLVEQNQTMSRAIMQQRIDEHQAAF